MALASVRMGIALRLPTMLADLIDGVRTAIGSPQIEQIEPHITLVPPLNVSIGDFEDFVYRFRLLCSGVEPFDVSLGSVSTFEQNNNVLFLEVRKSNNLLHLEKLLRGALDPRLPVRDYVPHVTIYDGAPDSLIEPAIELLQGIEAEFSVNEATLMLQDSKGVWQRYLAASFSSKRPRYAGGLQVTFFLAGAAGSWLAAALSEHDLELRYSAYGNSNIALGIDATNSEVTLGYHGAKLVCAGVVLISDAVAWLDYIWVEPSVREFGHSSILLDEIIYRLKIRGIRTLRLITRNQVQIGEGFERVLRMFDARGGLPIENELILKILDVRN